MSSTKTKNNSQEGKNGVNNVLNCTLTQQRNGYAEIKIKNNEHKLSTMPDGIALLFFFLSHIHFSNRIIQMHRKSQCLVHIISTARIIIDALLDLHILFF